MTTRSAGLLMYRTSDGVLEVLLTHPGGPFWAKKDDGYWGIPKGEFDETEEPLNAAIREFTEETGLLPSAPYLELGTARQSSGKVVFAWAFKGDWDPAKLQSNTFVLEWPPRSGSKKVFPEVDRAAWFQVPDARRKILKAQLAFIEALETLVPNRQTSTSDERQGQRRLFG